MKSDYFKKSILYFGVLFMGISHAVYPYGETNDVDARALALGNIKALSRGLSNPAYLAFKAQKELGASVYNRFRMKELNTMSIYALIPNRAIDAGFLLSTYGYEDYRILQGQVNLAKKLSSSFSIGTNLTCVNENSILEPGSKNYFSAGAGFYYCINESFEVAFTTENLLHTSNPFPVICDLGINYRLLPDCFVLIETGYDFRKYLEVKIGIEYEIAGQFSVRAGFRNQPKTPSMGFAYTGTRWKTEVAFLLHPILGLSSAIGVVYFF
ncbi:MAG: hypothetical protein LBR97_01220 [Dysgonamonadaceae bacterium]|jgi:hypothetical protein|nr:hypothetical protein [Dysgonamonadaceae bacterium]